MTICKLSFVCLSSQDAFVRLAQGAAPTLGYLKPASIESSFVPALQVKLEIPFKKCHYVSIYFNRMEEGSNTPVTMVERWLKGYRRIFRFCI